MPVIRVEVPAGTLAGTQETIRTAVKAAVLRTLAPKETKYDYVAVREVVGEIGDGVPWSRSICARAANRSARRRWSTPSPRY